MNTAQFLAIGLLLFLSLVLIAATTADLKPDRPFWPSTDHRADLVLSLLALVCAFSAGALL